MYLCTYINIIKYIYVLLTMTMFLMRLLNFLWSLSFLLQPHIFAVAVILPTEQHLFAFHPFNCLSDPVIIIEFPYNMIKSFMFSSCFWKHFTFHYSLSSSSSFEMRSLADSFHFFSKNTLIMTTFTSLFSVHFLQRMHAYPLLFLFYFAFGFLYNNCIVLLPQFLFFGFHLLYCVHPILPLFLYPCYFHPIWK